MCRGLGVWTGWTAIGEAFAAAHSAHQLMCHTKVLLRANARRALLQLLCILLLPQAPLFLCQSMINYYVTLSSILGQCVTPLEQTKKVLS